MDVHEANHTLAIVDWRLAIGGLAIGD